jgi:hypothetical protein
VRACGVQVFREVRRSFGVDDDSFKSSLGIKQVLGSFLMGDLTGLSELVSEGKSGTCNLCVCLLASVCLCAVVSLFLCM